MDEIGINYYYSDSADTFATWTAIAPLTDNAAFGQRQHGSVILLPGIDAFDFTAQTDVSPSTLIESNEVFPTGEAGTYAISVSAGGQYSIDSAPFTSAPGNFTVGEGVKVNQTSSSDPLTLTTVSLLIGGTSADFDVTTAAGMIPDSLLSQPTISDAVAGEMEPENLSSSSTVSNATMTETGNLGWISPPMYSAPGILASSVAMDYYVRQTDENGAVIIAKTTGMTAADGTLTINNQSLGSVGNIIEVFVEIDEKNLTWQSQIVIDLDA